MQRIFLFAVACILSGSMFAQTQLLTETHVLGDAGRTTVVVPFNPKLYNNQDSRMMCEASAMEYGQLGNYIRTSFDSTLTSQLRDSLNVVNLIASNTTGTSSDVEKIYSVSKYKYTDRPEPLESKSKLDMMRGKVPARFKKPTPADKKNGIQNGEIVSHKVDNSNRFMSVQFDDEDYISSMIMKYGAKYFLFITQFEILGDYSNPYQVAEKNYTRTIKVHYAIFSAEGKFITGDFATGEFLAYENDIKKICTTYFPPIAKKIARKIPR